MGEKLCLLALRGQRKRFRGKGSEGKVLRIDRPRGHSVARVQKVCASSACIV